MKHRTFYGLYLRRRTAEARLATYQRRGWEPSLRRRLRVYVIRVVL